MAFPGWQQPVPRQGTRLSNDDGCPRGEARLGSRSALRAAIPTEHRQFFDEPFLAANWYDVWPLAELGLWVATTIGTTSTELRKSVARQVARNDLKGPYRILLRIVSPSFLARNLPLATARHFDFGETKILEHLGSEVLLRRSGTPAELADWYTVAVAEWTCEALRMAGATRATWYSESRQAGRALGVPVVDIDVRVRWD